MVRKIKEKENKNIKEGTKHIIRYNSIKNSEDLLNKLREILILSLKNNDLILLKDYITLNNAIQRKNININNWEKLPLKMK